MHEMGIAMQIIDIARASIPEKLENPAVEKINLKIGKLSGIITENLQFCFHTATKDTDFSSVQLNIEEIPVIASCRACIYKWIINEPVFNCGKCGSTDISVIKGKDLEITSIELADKK